jgi:hypothetical protein
MSWIQVELLLLNDGKFRILTFCSPTSVSFSRCAAMQRRDADRF